MMYGACSVKLKKHNMYILINIVMNASGYKLMDRIITNIKTTKELNIFNLSKTFKSSKFLGTRREYKNTNASKNNYICHKHWGWSSDLYCNPTGQADHSNVVSCKQCVFFQVRYIIYYVLRMHCFHLTCPIMSIMQKTGRWNSVRIVPSEELQHHCCEIFFSDTRLRS